MPVPGSARQPELDDRVLRATPSGRAKGKTALVHEAEATPAGREATFRSDEHRATGAASGGARCEATSTGQPGRRAEEQLRCTELPACRRPRATRHRPKPWGTPTAPAEPFGSEASSSDGTGNRVSVNGARTLVRATGAGSNFGNGGRFADKTGPKGHRCRATGGGAIGCGAGQPETVANMGIARRAFGHDGRCVGRAKANARRSTSGGSSHLREAPGGCAGASQPHRPGRLTFSA